MSNTDDMSDTIKPNSEQLNSEDLLLGPITVTITGVARGSAEQPIAVSIDGGHMPFMPCKTVRRCLISCWGKNGADWVGKRMELFCDKSVTYAGVQVGGIRVSKVSGIDTAVSLMLSTKRGKRAPAIIHPLAEQEHYPAGMFDANLQAWSELLEAGKMTAEQIIAKAGERAPLTEEQIQVITSIVLK